MNIKKIIPMVTILSLFPVISTYADDSEFTTLYPIDITDSYYNQQDGEKITDFYGGYVDDADYYEIDINEIFMTSNPGKYYVSLPKDSYVTLSFEQKVSPGDSLVIETTGIANEKTDIYIKTNSGDFEFLDTITESKELHTITMDEYKYIRDVKLVGQDTSGDAPGSDIVAVYMKINNEAIETLDGRRRYDGHTYKLFDENMSWYEAKEYCEALGGYLACANSRAENTMLSDMISEGSSSRYWLGGFLNEDTEWAWLDGTLMDYDNWAEGEPNNMDNTESCTEMIRTPFDSIKFGEWNDMKPGGESDYGFICEWDNLKTSYDSEVSTWSTPEMEEAYDAGLIPETLIGTDLTEPVTRAEFSAVAVELYEALSKREVSGVKTTFKDISSDECVGYIEKAYGLDIVVGMSDTEFMPALGITREQLATMLCRTIKKYKFPEWTYETDSDYYLDSEGVKKFADDNEISDYAKPSVYYMVKMGIINGVDETHFAPRNTTTEQEAAGYASATREQAIALSLRTFKLSTLK